MALKKHESLADPKYDKQCAWNDHGYRCQSMGQLSQGVTGNGPWYCRDHFADLLGWPRWTVTERQETMADVDERVRKLVPPYIGETDHEWSMRCREWTLARLKRPLFQQHEEREPGEDLEAA